MVSWRREINVRMQEFGADFLMTYKLHTVTCHLADWIRLCGASAFRLEFWIERAVQYMKESVRYRSNCYPELMFMNDLLMDVAMRAMRVEHPAECPTAAEYILQQATQAPPAEAALEVAGDAGDDSDAAADCAGDGDAMAAEQAGGDAGHDAAGAGADGGGDVLD